jgi:hypothetical protein
MDERGLIDLPLQVNGLEVKVSPVAPLAMAQNMEEINNIMQFMQITSQLGTEGRFAIKEGDLIDMLAEKLGVPSSIRNSAAERAYLIDQQQQLAQQDQMMMAMAGNQQGVNESMAAGQEAAMQPGMV